MIRKILIVEDDIVFCKMLKSFFNRNSFDTFDAQTGKDAIKIIEEEDLDLVLLDYQLPDIKGTEVLSWVKTNKSTIKVLMMTANNNDELAIEARGLGVDDFVTKPINPNELLMLINRL